MYLSRVEIDDQDHQKINDLSHLGAYHNWVESSFPAEIAAKKRLRHLWRIDQLHGKRYLLLESPEKPDLDKFQRYGVEKTAMVKDYQPFIDQLKAGRTYRFRLVANPSYRKDGHCYPHVTVRQQRNWLLDRVAKHGFEIPLDFSGEPNFKITCREYPILYHSRRIRLSRVAFEGMLKITDLKKFKDTLINGLGREKAYGMGLLTVIPVTA